MKCPEYACPHCRAMNTIPPSMAGAVIECLKCDGTFLPAVPVVAAERTKTPRRPIQQKRPGFFGTTLQVIGILVLLVVGLALWNRFFGDDTLTRPIDFADNNAGNTAITTGYNETPPILFNSETEFQQFWNGNPDKTFGEYVTEGRIKLLTPGRQVKVIERRTYNGKNAVHVEVMDGKFAGHKGVMSVVHLK